MVSSAFPILSSISNLTSPRADEDSVPLVSLEHFRVVPELHTTLGIRHPIYDLTTDKGKELPKAAVLPYTDLLSSDMVVVSFAVVRKIIEGHYRLGFMADRVTRVYRSEYM